MGTYAPLPGYTRITLDELNDDGVELLISAIIRLAVEDYKTFLKNAFKEGLDLQSAVKRTNGTAQHVLKFFRSDYFEDLTAGMIDGEKIIEDSQKIAWNEYQESKTKKSKNGKNYKSKHITHAKKEKKNEHN